MIALGLVGLIALLLILRVNLVWILMAAAGYTHYAWGSAVLSFFVQDVWTAMDRELLIAIPLFVFVGQVMGRGSIAKRLINIIIELTRPFPSGLAIATVLSCAVFSAISGSSIVTMLAVGAVLFPALIEKGYSRRFAIGALCAGGTLGIVIPPSLPMILYGIVTESSITDLFLAGLGPGLLLTIVFSIYSVSVNRHMRRGGMDWSALKAAFADGILAMLMPIILLGGIYTGLFSPTESAAVAIFYAVLVETLIFRELSFKDYVDTSINAGKLVGSLFPLIAVAVSINLLLTENRVPHELVQWALANVETSEVFILTLNALLLLMGTFMETGSAIVIAAPLLEPLAAAYGFSATHLGIIMILNLEIGILTPPLGLNLIVAVTAFNEKFSDVCKAVLPWVLMMVCCLLLVTFIPSIAMGLVG